MTVSAGEYATRRGRVAEAIGEDGIALIPASPERVRNRDVLYPYRPDSDLRYLTGFTEPDAVAVLAPGHEDGEFILFCRDRDPDREIWDGLRAGPDGAVREYAADAAHPIEELEEYLPRLLGGRERLYYTLGEHPAMDERVIAALRGLRAGGRRGARAPASIVSLDGILHEMRLRKSPGELDLMRAAAATSARAHCRAMRAATPGMPEYRLAAELHHEFERDGMEPAYPSIVGGGANACILHYIENAATLADGDLVLIDAGAEHAGYAADITRTFPVNGRFSGPQRDLYAVVLAAQKAAILAVRPGYDYEAPHRAAVRVLTQGLVDLGLLEGGVDELVEKERYRRFYMHGTGHWLGMDVHDVGDYRQGDEWRELEPDMTLTIEPGLYVPAGSEGVDERFWDIGIRIEDDVRVTERDPEILTADVPKDMAAIEALMAERA
ncbi:peptidase M24 [Salinisphaera sp. PC39]|uniref:aminopeptidase P N-terminal domain-containing protein n=1 Tax=Salinisphaera sp. PC39 TaxID=1304156 RepID=UPI003340F2ED